MMKMNQAESPEESPAGMIKLTMPWRSMKKNVQNLSASILPDR